MVGSALSAPLHSREAINLNREAVLSATELQTPRHDTLVIKFNPDLKTDDNAELAYIMRDLKDEVTGRFKHIILDFSHGVADMDLAQIVIASFAKAKQRDGTFTVVNTDANFQARLERTRFINSLNINYSPDRARAITNTMLIPISAAGPKLETILRSIEDKLVIHRQEAFERELRLSQFQSKPRLENSIIIATHEAHTIRLSFSELAANLSKQGAAIDRLFGDLVDAITPHASHLPFTIDLSNLTHLSMDASRTILTAATRCGIETLIDFGNNEKIKASNAGIWLGQYFKLAA